MPMRTSPMLGRYLVRNRVANAGLRMTDATLGVLNRARAPEIPDDPQRILIATGGHLGDAVMATAILADLHAAFPHARLDVTAPSWNVGVFDGHPLVNRVHVVDHWKLNRAAISRRTKVAHYLSTATRAVREIVALKYDVAIDTYPFFPNAAGVLWRARVPVRIGYASGGFGPLYTHTLDWVDDREHITTKQRRLSRILAKRRELPSVPQYALAPTTTDVDSRLDRLLGADSDRSIVILHAGAGTVQKDWPLARWVELATKLDSLGGARVVLTGAGARDAEIAQTLAAQVPGCRSLVDALSWAEFVGVVRRSALVVSGDTSAAHVAAACATPHITLFTGINDSAEFRPLSQLSADRSAVLMQAVPCAPCFRNDGCEAMSCIREIETDHVLRTALEMLSKS